MPVVTPGINLAAGTVDASRPVFRPAGRDDLIRVPGGKWAIWPLACLRAAGFPAEHVLRLSSPVSARLAVRLLQSRGPEARAALRATFSAERLRVRSALRDLAADPSFREAVVWQNRRAFKYAVAPLAAAPIEHLDSEMRKKELLVASYAQRYSVKNETIGFFGPVGWARFSEGPIAATVECGPALLAARQVYFESWCIDEVARALDTRPELGPWRIPRLQPFVRLEGTRVMTASRVIVELPPDHARLLAACDGTRHAKALARDFQSACGSSFPTDAAVDALLECWQRAGYLTWTFEGPRELHPERTLGERLGAIDDRALRERAQAELQAIEASARLVQAAAGDAEALDGALDALESTFSRITGIPPTRSAGQMYAARTLVYEDCRRDVAVDFGSDVLRRLGPPMSLVLQSARWAVHELARRHALELRRAYDLLSGGGRREVTLGSFFARTSLVGDSRGALSPVAAGVRAALQQRWAEVLGASPAAHRIQFRSRDLRPAVSAAFHAPGAPPSAWARYISPDVMIDAPSIEAIRRGEYQIVLGEVHVINTLAQSAFMTQCPDADGVIRALDRDCPDPRVFWLAPKEASPQRVQYSRKPNDFVYAASRDPSPAPPDRTLPVAELVVVDAAGALVVQTRDGRLRFPCLEFFGYLMMRKEVNLFGPLASQSHRPRVTIDDVVICREQWQV
ncbi:MAG: lantibiotic dehydratase, partial [Vicinamibacterales bacterium]